MHPRLVTSLPLKVGLCVALALGAVQWYGAVAGYFTGAIDNVLMRVVDVIIAFPTTFLLLMLVGMFEASIGFLIVILGLTSWTGTARFVRGEILSLKERQFVEAARALGVPWYSIISRHLIPNAMAPVLVSAAFMSSTSWSSVSPARFASCRRNEPQVPRPAAVRSEAVPCGNCSCQLTRWQPRAPYKTHRRALRNFTSFARATITSHFRCCQ